MKVCTDATLFGAMSPINGGEKVLDIGTGTGVLALMAAQLGAKQVTAVELTKVACNEAAINFRNSPWSDRLKVIHQDIRDFAKSESGQYDLIISNPPFFENHSKTGDADALRKTARHTDDLPHDDLITAVDKLLSVEGVFYLLIPTHAVTNFCSAVENVNLYLLGQTDIRGYAHNVGKVTALTFSRLPCGQPPTKSLVTIYREQRIYSDECERYLTPFLLRFADSKKTVD